MVAQPEAKGAGGGPLVCSFKLASPARLGRPVMLWVQLRNVGPHTLWLLPWNSPLEGMFNAYLEVSGPEGELSYQGPMIKRGAPAPSDYQRLIPGQSLSAQLDLNLGYAFKRTGIYEVRWQTGLIDHHTGEARPKVRQGEHRPLTPVCAPLRFELLP